MRGLLDFELDKAKVQKYECEQEFARELYKIFETTPSLVRSVRMVARLLAKDILQMYGEDAFLVGYQMNDFMGLWKNFTPNLQFKGKSATAVELKTVIEDIASRPITGEMVGKKPLTVSACGDVIRYVAECTEQIVQPGKRLNDESKRDKWEIMAQMKQSFRRAQFDYKQTSASYYKQASRRVNRNGGSVAQEIARLEKRHDFFQQKGEGASRIRANSPGRSGTDLLTGVIMHDGFVLVDATGNPTGMTGKAQVRGSVVKAIDDMFGLYTGCDISGTTTDVLFSLQYGLELMDYQVSTIAAEKGEEATHFNKLANTFLSRDHRPLLLMMPLGSIAAAHHHTLIEVAMPMSLNDLNDYSIGFYTTLWPKFGSQEASESSKSVGPGKAIWELLERFDKDKRNRKLLVYQDPKRGIQVGVQMGVDKKGQPATGELARFKDIANLRKGQEGWLGAFSKRPQDERFPDKRLVEGLVGKALALPELPADYTEDQKKALASLF